MVFGEVIEVVEAVQSDISAIAMIAKEVSHNPWTKKQFEEQLPFEFSRTIVAKNQDEVLGFCCFELTLDGAHINEIGVAQTAKRKGVGTKLVGYVEQAVLSENLEGITLEVRKQDDGANGFYQKLGFVCLGRRRDFYKNPKDDANVMKKTLL